MFTRELRYIVLKITDLQKADCSVEDLEALNRICNKVIEHRESRGKKILSCVVVEDDWPEYEATWKALEERAIIQQPLQPDNSHDNWFNPCNH